MSSSSSSSVLFQPYRSLGLISSSTRPHLKLLGQERFLTAALGKSWCVYNLDKLRVSLMGGAREFPIRSIVSARDLTFTANGREIIVWRRQEEVYRIQFHQSNVYLLYLFGFTLISVSEDQQLAVWDVRALTPATSVKSQVATALTMSNNVAKKTFVSQTGEKMDSDWKAEPISVIQFPNSSRISSVLHPSTYLNKIVVAFGGGEGSAAAGGLELWNIKTRTMIYRFKTDSWNSDKHNPDRALDATLGRTSGVKNEASAAAPAVTCMEQSPAVDVIAVGLHSGLILLLNLQLDQLLHVYLHATPTASGEMVSAPIASVTFRTDNNQSQLASTTTNSGTVCIWDLEKKQLRTQIKHAHGIASSDGTAVRGTATGSSDSSVTIHSLFFLPNEPLLLTVGTDNAIRMWIFDNPDGTARLLKERAGHSGPPSRIRFYPGERNCLDVVSAGLDRSLRAFSLQKEEQSREFSQGSVEKKAKNFSMATSDLKLTPVVDFAVSTARERDWANILTAHAGDCAGYTWKWSSRALSQHKLLNTNAGAMASAVKSVAVSACGNFGYLGYTNGRIDSFHMQSGTWKASFGSNHSSEASTGGATLSKDLQSKNINLKRKAAKEAAKAAANGSAESQLPPNFGHSAAVTGVATDGLNKQVISASLDGSVIFWDFKRRHVSKRLTFDSPISRMTYSRENDLVAVVTDRLVVHVIDAITYAVVRRFKQHTAPLTDLCFSPDARWLLTSSIDCCVRIFDLPSSTMIDYMKFNKPISSLTMSPKCDFLATTHVGNLGIYLWANKDYFGNSSISGADLAGEAKVRRVYKNKPVEMEVKERATGEESDEDMEDGEEPTHTRMKLEPLSDSESDEDEDEEDEQDRKRRKTSSEPVSALSQTHTPFLHIPDEEQFGLITYSTVAKAKWQTLAHLEEIKERNKVKEAVRAPKDAPFFLTAISSLSNEKDGASIREKERLAETFGVSATETSASSTAPALGKRTVKSGGASLESTLINLIEEAKTTLAQLVSKKGAVAPSNPRLQLIQAFDKVTEFLQDLTPAGIDAEIASLGLDPSTEEHEFQLVLEYFLAGLESQKGFEFIQALLNRFLKIHGSSLINYPQLLKLCQTLLNTQKSAWGRLEQSFQANLALVSHLAQIQL